jgi:diaminohydroxyphosphoribosylaminopyrimidine deaminase/5-amino-6-(5-phosphoribosylamino)uracil reductase
MVGCVIVQGNTIVGQGYHQKAGEAHAEIHALKEAGTKAYNADVYVTLEPCCHHGRTPPCTDALIRAGVKRVFIACQDPNPLVAHKGIQALNQAGIETIVGIKESEALALNKIFFHFIQHRTPFVIAKWAMSLDGKMITHPDDDRIISDEACRHHAHEIRQTVDAILIGAKTAIADNPQLNVRLPNITKQPKRIILSSQGDLPTNLKLFSNELPSKTTVATTKPVHLKNAECWVLPQNANGQVDLSALLKKCGEENITSLLVEGGPEIHQSFFHESLVQETHVYISPVWIGKEEKKKPLPPLEAKSLGKSLFIQTEATYV